MNLDELMAVWKSQDAAPLHDVNKALLQQALRQEQANLQKTRRREKWIICVFSTGVAVGMALLLAMMIATRERKVMTAWDYVVGMGGVAASLVAMGVIYAGHRSQARREQHFGDSLRAQINRRITQLDDATTGGRRRGALIFVLMGVIWLIAILHLGMRVNQKSLSDVSWIVVASLILCFLAGARSLRRAVPQAIARKRDLEALLKELDGR